LARHALWTVAGPGSRLEARLARTVHPTKLTREDRDGYRLTTATSLIDVEPTNATAPEAGIYLFGGCDVRSLFAIVPLIAPTLRRRVVIRGVNAVASSRADVLLQSLAAPTGKAVRETLERMRFPSTYFRPLIFEPHVAAAGSDRVPKSVIVLGVGASATRPAYRHKKEGFVIDPGGRWLRDRDKLSRDELTWFKSNFESVGRLPVDQFVRDFARVVQEVHERTHAEVVVFNTLTVEPGSRDHNYQLRRSPDGIRRLQFHVALADLAQDAGFHVLDVDDVLKRAGVQGQLDFVHFPKESYPLVAAEGARLLRELEVF
jgi:hypothetical protein